MRFQFFSNLFYVFFLDEEYIIYYFRDVAQPGSALHWGCSGRRFKSGHPDHLLICVFFIYNIEITVFFF